DRYPFCRATLCLAVNAVELVWSVVADACPDGGGPFRIGKRTKLGVCHAGWIRCRAGLAPGDVHHRQFDGIWDAAYRYWPGTAPELPVVWPAFGYAVPDSHLFCVPVHTDSGTFIRPAERLPPGINC